MKALYCLTFIVALFYGCEKAKDRYLDGHIAGRIFYFNPNEPLKGFQAVANKTVLVGEIPSDTLNYSRAVLSDKDGYFIINHLTEGTKYLVFFADSIDNFFYKGALEETANNDSIQLIVQPDSVRQNGLRISVHDPLGQPVPKAQICLFNNISNLNTNNCTGSIGSFSTNTDGNYVVYKLTPGVYYLLATAIIGNKSYRGKTTVTVTSNGIMPAPVNLVQVDTGFDITATDINGSPLNGVNICVFSSQTLFQADDCNGKIFSLTTDSLGKVQKYGLAPGVYYLRSELSVGSVHLIGHDELTVVQDIITPKSLILK